MGWHTMMVNNSLHTTWITMGPHPVVQHIMEGDFGIITASMYSSPDLRTIISFGGII